MFLKAYEKADDIKYYYKMSNYDSIRGIYGHEAVNEIVAQNIANILDIHVLQYEPVKCLISVNNKNYITLITRSRDFKNTEESKITLEIFYDLYNNGEDIVEMFTKKVVFKDLDDIDEFVPNVYKENVFDMVSRGLNMLRKNLFVSLKRSCEHPAMLTYDDETKNLVCRF